jgi:sulfate adenylyltransferase subunit 2
MNEYTMNHIMQLESEAIYVIREVKAQFERPVMLFSGGKDSICMAHIARKAFYPGKIPFPLMHIDTGHNFKETLEYRDSYIKELSAKLIVRNVQDSIDKGRVQEESGHNPGRNALQTITLLDSIKEFEFDCAMGGARRDEEKARAKERFFSLRNNFGEWDPKNQRPELWNIFNGHKNKGNHFRVFPLSNWTEFDVWQYIALENIPMPSLYFSHKRKILNRDGVILACGEYVFPDENEKSEEKIVRFRTIGDMTCTGAVESKADTIYDIIAEIASTRTTERGGRADDKRSETAMEDRKKQGYF